MEITVSRIFELLSESGNEQKAFAKAIGATEQNVTEWKNGKTKSWKNFIVPIAAYFGVTTDYLLGVSDLRENNADFLPERGLRFVPVFETVSAGLGAYADSCPVGVVADYIESDYDARNTIAIKVRGDSMWPKIEDGDLVIVRKDAEWRDGSIVVALIDGEEGVVKRIFQSRTRLTLESTNNAYPPRHFDREEMDRVQVVGVVKMILKEA